MAMKVSLSFKESEKEMYDFLQSQLSSSIFIKGLIQKEMQCKGDKKENKKKNNNFDLDF